MKRKKFVNWLIIILVIQTSTGNNRAIVIGASSGMGREVAKLLAADGYIVGLSARRLDLLKQVQQEIPTTSYVKQIDASKPEEAIHNLQELINQIGGLDLLIISISGWRDSNIKSILDVDIMGFYALAHFGLNFFEKQSYGHFVGFSSIDGLRGIANHPEYSASKAFCSRYMEAKRNYYIQNNISITVTDIIPGWVNSTNDPNLKNKNPKAYWIESLKEASQEIIQAIKDKTPAAYITKRWKQVADTIKTMPDDLYNALGGL